MLAAQDSPPEHRRRKLYSGFRKNEARLPSRPQEPSERLPNCPCNLSAPFLPLPEFGLAYAAPQARYAGRQGVSVWSRAMRGSCKARNQPSISIGPGATFDLTVT